MKTDSIRVIIVDDHQMIRETWKSLLQGQSGIDVIGECSSGQEAIKMIPELLPDIVLMDINMSPVNGFEATKKIVKLCPQVRIIGISVNNQPGYAKNIMQLGAKGYVTKNSRREEMIQAIVEVAQGQKFICREVMNKMTEN